MKSGLETLGGLLAKQFWLLQQQQQLLLLLPLLFSCSLSFSFFVSLPCVSLFFLPLLFLVLFRSISPSLSSSLCRFSCLYLCSCPRWGQDDFEQWWGSVVGAGWEVLKVNHLAIALRKAGNRGKGPPPGS